VKSKACVVATILLLGGCLVSGNAQQSEPLPSPAPEGDESDLILIPVEPPSLIEERPWERVPFPSQRLQLTPPIFEPVLPPLQHSTSKQNALSSARVFVKKFQITGNHIFSNETLLKVIGKYSGQEITAEELEQARQDLSLFYINHGYINSGATLPDQNVESGVITLQIVEGKVSRINVTGNYWFRSWWVRNEIRRAAWRSLNFNKLKEGLQLLRMNPSISRINAELKPGGVPGESIIDVDIKDTQPFRFALEFSNKRPPSVGAEILEAQFADLNLTGHNDPLQVRYGIAHTTANGGFDFSGLDNIEGTYEFPITPWATTLLLHANKSDTSIIEDPFTTLDITSNLEEYGAMLRQPLYRTLSNEFAISLMATRRESKTYLLGRPFSLSPGAVNGVTTDFVLRFAQEFVNRSQVHVLALRSTFNFGLDALGATNSGSEPDANFFFWLGQGQYVRRLGKTDNLLLVRCNVQLSNSPLFSLEQLSFGGAESVRGYRENDILRDNGVFGSVEVRVPVWFGKGHTPLLLLAPFFDIGVGWNTLGRFANAGTNSQEARDRLTETLPSVGIGFIFNPNKYVHSELYWGYAFNRDLVIDGNNLQDYGIHFVVTVNAF
jgi:hemolysin activation/secretion protein